MSNVRAFVITFLVIAALAGCGRGAEEERPEGATTGVIGGGTETATAPAEPVPGTTTPTAAPVTAAVIQTQEVDATPGMVGELIEATRKEGVLTVKVRFRNTGSERTYHGFETGHGDYSYFYVTAAEQKYFVLKDTEGAPLAPKYLSPSLEPGQTVTWWAKFPAPPASETKFDLVVPDMPPFEDIPITDR